MSFLSRAADAPRWMVSSLRIVSNSARDLVALVRGGGLAAAIEPWMRVDAIDDVPFESIAAQGVDAALFDLENTLIPPGGPFDDEGRAIVARAGAAGLAVAVVSNASAGWVGPALRSEGIPYVAPAGKPSSKAFLDACALVGVPAERAVYIGDQVITDVLGAQRAGLRAVLVKPKYTAEFKSAKFQRVVARAVIRLARQREANV